MITEKSRPWEEGGSLNKLAGHESKGSMFNMSSALDIARDRGAWYWLGVEHERARIAEAWTELDECWRPMGPQRHAERVQQRRNLFRSCAEEFAASMDRTYAEYPGGPVDWETGRPVRHVAVTA